MKTDIPSIPRGKWLAAGLCAIATGALVVACGGSDDTQVISSGTVIQNATIVNTRDGSTTTGASVVVDGGKIQSITSGPVQVTGSAVALDATGKFVVPGFLDMHTHASNTLSLAPSDFPVLLANGVTGVREASGTPALLQTIRAQNAQVTAGRADAPEVLLMPTAIFAGQAATDAAARQFVRDRLAEGADYIKATGGAPAAFLAVLDEAKRQGKYAAGHLPVTVTSADASAAGYHSFEHLGSGVGLMLDCSSDDATIRAGLLATPVPPPANVINPRLYDGNPWGAYYQRIVDTYSPTKCQALAKTFVQNDTWQTVTLIRLRTQDFGDSALYRQDPNLRYVDRTRRALWESIAQQYAATVTPANRAALQNYYAQQLKVVKLMQDNGVKILAGSDLGGGLVIPGFSLHQEFKELAAAGLTPLQVLQATTLNGAQFVGREAIMGTVEAGKNADLVLLDANPLADVANLDRVSSLFLRGKFYSRAALDALLTNVAVTYQAAPLRALSTALDPTHVD